MESNTSFFKKISPSQQQGQVKHQKQVKRKEKFQQILMWSYLLKKFGNLGVCGIHLYLPIRTEMQNKTHGRLFPRSSIKMVYKIFTVNKIGITYQNMKLINNCYKLHANPVVNM